MRFKLLPLAFILIGSHANAADTVSAVAEMAEKAISKGYGAECSLEYQLVTQGGYYPCIDFGPYRYVREYQKIVIAVVQKDKKPFPILSGRPTESSFIYDGPWQRDLADKMTIWWYETVDGNKARREQEAQASSERSAAAEYIDALNRPPEVKSENDKPAEPAKVEPTEKTEEIQNDVLDILTRGN